MKVLKIGIIGGGFISGVHLLLLKNLRGLTVKGIFDKNIKVAKARAKSFQIEKVYTSIEDLLSDPELDAVHILVPPKNHYEVARQCLNKGLHCLVEKPLCLKTDQILDLIKLSNEKKVVLGVNHNMVFVKSFLKLLNEIKLGRFGRPENLHIIHNVPLRQLETGDFSHFMFRAEANILWEQGVHLFSLVLRILGNVISADTIKTERIKLQNGFHFIKEWEIIINCEKGTAKITMRFGEKMPETRLFFIGTDGSAGVDLIRDTYTATLKTKWHDSIDISNNALRNAFSFFSQSVASVSRYLLFLFRMYPASDPFTESMKNSIWEFYKGVRGYNSTYCKSEEALEVQRICEYSAKTANASTEEFPVPEIGEPKPARENEILITGGTGFIGKKLIPLLLDNGMHVSLLIRKPENLPLSLIDKRIRYFKGDVLDKESIIKAIKGAKYVIHMATGLDPSLPIDKSMEESAKIIGEACLDAGVKRLIFISSSAALYLGDKTEIKEDKGPDPRPELRPPYSRGKIFAEKTLKDLEKSKGLKLVILRPFVVIGEGGNPEHTGVGLWPRDNHCIGWGMGKRPIPFVLVDDCAQAIVNAITKENIDGKTYNIIGNINLTPMEYIRELRKATGRAYYFHPQPLVLTWLFENAKALLKRLGGRKGLTISMRDLRSRAFITKVSNEPAIKDLDWSPVSEKNVFIEKGIAVYGKQGT